MPESQQHASCDPITIIITGGTGCVGFAIVNALLKHYDEINITISIHILDISIPSPGDRRFIRGVSQYHKIDVTDATAVTLVFQSIKPAIVIHTASIIPSVARNEHISDQRLWGVNVDGTKNVLDAAEQCGTVRAFVYTSTCDVVKPSSRMDFVNASERETAYLVNAEKWDGEYPRTKAKAEMMVLSEDRKIRTCAIRTHGVVGKHDQNLFPLVATAPRKICLGSGKNLYDFSSVGNVALAHLLAIDNLLLEDKQPSANRRAFFISDGAPRPFRELQEMIWREADNDPNRDYGWYLVVPAWLFMAVLRFIGLFMTTHISPHDIRDAVATRYFDIGEARRVLGYEPKNILKESLRDACQSWREREGKAIVEHQKED